MCLFSLDIKSLSIKSFFFRSPLSLEFISKLVLSCLFLQLPTFLFSSYHHWCFSSGSSLSTPADFNKHRGDSFRTTGAELTALMTSRVLFFSHQP